MTLLPQCHFGTGRSVIPGVTMIENVYSSFTIEYDIG